MNWRGLPMRLSNPAISIFKSGAKTFLRLQRGRTRSFGISMVVITTCRIDARGWRLLVGGSLILRATRFQLMSSVAIARRTLWHHWWSEIVIVCSEKICWLTTVMPLTLVLYCWRVYRRRWRSFGSGTVTDLWRRWSQSIPTSSQVWCWLVARENSG